MRPHPPVGDTLHMVQTEQLASYVRRKFLYVHCHACLAADFQTGEHTIREKSQVLALLPEFRVSDGICSGCGRVKILLEWNPH
jgi:hypothetical protein